MIKSLYILILLFTIVLTSRATTYYFSANGNDASNGTSTSTPWQTLGKLNSVFSSLSPGDNVLFKRGDIFYGSITINKSGSAGLPITISAYGSGADPIITGFTTINSWTNLGGNIWESSSAASTLPTCNIVVINRLNTAMGRFPNTGYLAYQSHSGSTSITSSSLNSSVTNWTGAEAVVRSSTWTLERDVITSHSGGTINYQGLGNVPVNGYGFFIQNDSRTLDTLNEWYYDPSTKKIRIYNTTTPSNVQVPTIDELVLLSGANYVTFDHIDFEGTNSYILENRNSKYITVRNCNFSFAGKIATYINNAVSANEIMTIDSNVFSDNNENAMSFLTWTSNVWIKNNTISNTGVIPGAGSNNQNSCDAMDIYGTGTIVENNIINNTGHIAVAVRHSDGIIVRYNYITYFGMTRYDAGGIYSWNSDSITVKSRIIDHNIVLYGKQTSDGIGTDAPLLFGIYLDGSSKNTSITDNTIANCKNGDGIHILNSGSCTITNNISYNNGNQLAFLHAFGGGTSITGMVVKHNNFFSKANNQLAFYFREDSNPFNTFGSADSNYYARPVNDSLTIQTTIFFSPTNRTLANWQTFVGQDLQSNKSPKTISDTNDLRFEYNATASDKRISIPYNYIDVKNTSYNGSITLAPFTSAVLIKNGAIASNQSPTANAGIDQSITLPTNSVSLSGSGTDADGSIATYGWTMLSGSPGCTLTSPGSAATSVTGLVQGVYRFELTVTDNQGATDISTVQITVNAANIPPTANAGTNQSITLPTNTVLLSGSGADTDGTISTFGWIKTSGPSGGSITSPGSAATSVTGLVQGTYQFQLTVTDNNGAYN